MKIRNFIASILIIGSASTIVLPNPANAGWAIDSLMSDEMIKGYEYDRDVLDKKREDAGKDITRSKMQRKIMSCTLGPWLGSQCIKDWDWDGINRGAERAKNGMINGIKHSIF